MAVGLTNERTYMEQCHRQVVKVHNWAIYLSEECTWHLAELSDVVGTDWDIVRDWTLLGPTPKRYVTKDQLKATIVGLPVDQHLAESMIERLLA